MASFRAPAIALGLLAFGTLFAAAPAKADWYGPGWGWRRPHPHWHRHWGPPAVVVAPRPYYYGPPPVVYAPPPPVVYAPPPPVYYPPSVSLGFAIR
ncbi:MAG: hypothetical protein BGO51_19390 [Rhodospirillales bacterium 69-11]|nr:hypothetical protein [Rhodospirillales bacterium]OJW28642.1 MAG: hypothetical protein BGO51_19390 [Rhodospirillales bacterium 69-11]